MAAVQLVCGLGRNKIAHAYRGSRVIKDTPAAQNVGAASTPGAEAAAHRGCGSQGQLVGGNSSRAENGGNDRRQQWNSDALHVLPPFYFNG